VLLAVAGCVPQPGGNRQASALNAGGPAAPAGKRAAILLPLTGPNAEVGQALLKAAQLSMAAPGSPPLDSYDTGGTPDGASRVAAEALGKGAGIILGPLTSGETAAVAPVARAAGVPVLAFTSDATQGGTGVWVLGITPAQQVRRLVLAVQAENKTKLAAVLPTTPFGDALAAGLLAATSAARLPDPRVVRPANGFGPISDALKDVSGYATRRGAIEADQRTARASRDQDTRRQAAEIGRRPVPPPPVDALLLGVTGDLLGQVVPLLAGYDIGPDQVRVLGPATWAREAARQPGLAGAWYAAPDPKLRSGFEQQYTARYNAPARDFTTIAYDAAGIARATVGPEGWPVGALTRSEGFAGADGLVALEANGQVRRGLAIFEVDRGGSHIVQPAPQTLSAPGV
jgi:branched-chain amino acid transport system substrate-binding protein